MASLLIESLRSPILRPLLAADLLLIIVHFFVALSPNEESRPWSYYLRIDHDRSISEWLESAELGAAIFLLVRHARRYHRPSFLMVGGLLAIMLLDNILELREYVALSFMPGQQALAEFVTVAAIAPFLAGLACLTYRRAAPTERSELAAMLVVLGVFAMFAVVTDFLHELALPYGSMIYGGIAALEDAGELVTLSLLLALVLHLTSRKPSSLRSTGARSPD